MLSAEAKQQKGKIILTYTIQGTFDGLFWPKPKEHPTRCDGIWNGTCFELFLSGKNQEKYLELNFCPSGDWACYAFPGYRSSPTNPNISRPVIEQVGHAILTVSIDWQEINLLIGEPELVEGSMTACLLEEKEQSFWAYKHPETEADFHDRNCFINMGLGNKKDTKS